ncbi:MAG: molybdate ABC transporter permease subunit [Nitrospinae bacterium]|nr:molybdate ABC transporter permease subunit [Nitrospinota bacterium]
MELDLQPLLLTFKLATISSLLLLLLGTIIACWLANGRGKIYLTGEILVALPLILPPSVLGFYLLLLFSPESLTGQIIESLTGLRLLFSFEGLIAASVIATLPFMVFPVKSGIENLPVSLREASATLGKSTFTTSLRVLLPNIKPSLLAGFVLSFAHVVGEFGVVLMIGGGIPGETKVASIALYDEVEALNYGTAHFYALGLFTVTFLVLVFVYFYNKRSLLKGF